MNIDVEKTTEPLNPDMFLEWLASIYASACWYRCLIGIIFAAIASFISFGLQFVWADGLEYSLFYPAVMLSALLGGFASGAMAFIVSAIAVLLLFSPFYDGLAGIELGIFLTSSFVLSLAAEALHRMCVQMRNKEARRANIERLVNESFGHEFASDRIGMWELNFSKNIIQDIGNTRKILGFSDKTPLRPNYISQIILPEDREKILINWYAAHEPSGTGLFEAVYRIQRPNDGEIRWIAARGQAYFKSGKPEHMIGIHRDITESKHAEALHSEKARLDSQLESIAFALPGAIYSYRLESDGKATFPYAAPHANEILGLDAADLAKDASLIFDRVHPDDFTNFRSTFLKSKREGTLWGGSFRFYHPKKGLIWLESQATPVREADGSILWHGYVQDVTQRKQSEANLAESEERLRAVIDGAGDAIISIDDFGTMLSVNPSGAKMFQYADGELIGQNVRVLMPEQDRNRHSERLKLVTADNGVHFTSFNRELQGLRKDGSLFPVELSVSLAKYDHQHLFVGFVRDLTELRKIEAHVARLQTERLTAMGGMAAGLAHELNQPLSAAAAYLQSAQLLLDMPEDMRTENISEMIRFCTDQMIRAGRIVSHLRKFIVLGEPDKIFYHIHELLRQIAELMASYAQHADIGIVLKLDAKLDRVLIDPVQINQVVMNLIRNAIQAMSTSAHRILIVSTELHASNLIQINIIDHGSGISKDVEASLHIMARYGLLQILKEAQYSASHYHLHMARFSMNTRENVHVIDDDLAIRASLKALLSIKGYNVHVHETAKHFLDMVQPGGKGCVITDIRMPEMTGLELLKTMKERKISLPVIVMTAFADVSIAVEALKKGAVDFVEKPFNSEMLCDSVQDALARNSDLTVHNLQKIAIEKKLEALTAREQDVLAILLKGKSNKNIAYELGIGIRTVETHRANIMEKMRAGSLSELLRMSLIRRGPELAPLRTKKNKYPIGAHVRRRMLWNKAGLKLSEILAHR
eukprot:gene17326-17519_t